MKKKLNLIKILGVLLLLLLLIGCGENINSEQKDREGETYKVSYIYDGELLSLKPNYYLYGEEMTLPTYNIKGFIGWYENKDLSGEMVTIIPSDSYGNKVFYAKVEYVKETYTITYYDGATKLDLTPSTYTEDDIVSLPKAPEVEGKTFSGWYLEKTFKTLITSITSTDRGNKTFYAKYEEVVVDYVPFVPTDAKRLTDAIKVVNNGKGVTRGMPSTGEVKVLVIPVDFTDYPAEKDMTQNLNKALFGISADTGWESLQSYYKKSSYDQLTITGTVTDVYSTGKKSSYFDNLGDYDGVNEIIKGALTYFDSTIDYSEYDSDSDGYIDSIYFVYTTAIDYDSDDSIWWAFTDEYVTTGHEYYDNVEADYYIFAGYDFLFEEPECGTKLTFNTETFIHETGHLLGVDDYYDYDSSDYNNVGGIGGGDMMDYNVGDHNAYTKTILGWITPTVIEANKLNVSLDLTLNSFSKSGDAIIIAKTFNNSFFAEYFIIDYYTPDGLNELEAGCSGLFSESGIRIYHVTSSLSTSSVDTVWDITKYNNASSRYKLLELVEADNGDDISYGYSSENSDLFVEDEVISTLKWNDKTSTNVTIKVTSIENDKATLTISNTK